MYDSEQTTFGVADILVTYSLDGGSFYIRSGASVMMARKAGPHARNWGYGPGGIVDVVLLIVIVLVLLGRL